MRGEQKSYSGTVKSQRVSTITASVFLLTAVVIGALGVLVREFGMVELIAGYDPETVTDEEGLATFVGTALILLAGVTVVVAVLEVTQPVGSRTLVYSLYSVVTVALTGYVVYGARQYAS